MTEDKVTVGLTAEASEVMERLMETELFVQELDLAKFALAFAIQKGVQPGSSYPELTTKWNIGSLDPNGSLRKLMQIIYPGIESPTRAIEFLVNEGLRLLQEDLGKMPNATELVFSLMEAKAEE